MAAASKAKQHYSNVATKRKTLAVIIMNDIVCDVDIKVRTKNHNQERTLKIYI
jgi:hypothetical protein